MSTRLPTVSASRGTTGRGTGTISGAAQGAAAGMAVGGPVGALVGAGIGALGGWLGGSKQDSAARHATLAYKYARTRVDRQAAVARRDIIRQFRVARAGSLVMGSSEEGGNRSSSPMNAAYSLNSQFANNLGYFDADAWLNMKYMEHSNKAGKKAASANMISSTMGAVASAAISMRGAFGTPSPPTVSTGGGGPVSTTPMGSNTYGGANWGTFAPPPTFK